MNDNKKKSGLTLANMIIESHDAKKLSTMSFIIATLAFVASSISVYYSYQDSVTDDAWQNSQIKLIKKLINENTISNQQHLISLQYEKSKIQKLEEINKSLLKILKQNIYITSEDNKS